MENLLSYRYIYMRQVGQPTAIVLYVHNLVELLQHQLLCELQLNLDVLLEKKLDMVFVSTLSALQRQY